MFTLGQDPYNRLWLGSRRRLAFFQPHLNSALFPALLFSEVNMNVKAYEIIEICPNALRSLVLKTCFQSR